MSTAESKLIKRIPECGNDLSAAKSVFIKKLTNAFLMPGMADKALLKKQKVRSTGSRSIYRRTDNGRGGLENVVSLCLTEIIYKDTHFQPLDQIFKVKNI